MTSPWLLVILRPLARCTSASMTSVTPSQSLHLPSCFSQILQTAGRELIKTVWMAWQPCLCSWNKASLESSVIVEMCLQDQQKDGTIMDGIMQGCMETQLDTCL